MTVYARKSAFINKARKFHRKLVDSRPNERTSLYLFEYDEFSDPINDSLSDFAKYFIYFLKETGD